MPESVSDPISQLSEDLTTAVARWGEVATDTLTGLLARTTTETGALLEAVAENPLVQVMTGLPVLDRLPAFLGEIDRDLVRDRVLCLQAEMPTASAAEVAERIITDTALQAASVGLVTNIVPPVALTLFAVDLAAVTQLQVEMAYSIAAAYGFSLDDAVRRGEVLAIFGFSLGGSGILKAGLGFIEIVPGIGAVIGASTNAISIYALGYTACRYYEARRDATLAAGTDLLLDSKEYLQQAAARQIVLDQLLAHVVLANDPKLTWSELSPQLQRFALTSDTAKDLASLETLEPVKDLLDRLDPADVKPLLVRCEQIVRRDGTLAMTPAAGVLLTKISVCAQTE